MLIGKEFRTIYYLDWPKSHVFVALALYEEVFECGDVDFAVKSPFSNIKPIK